jgi:DTW domain-containing protein YfiP
VSVIDKIDNDLFLLVLQHPQEKTEKLATVPLLESNLANMRKAVGLSWPNLARALGRDSDPKSWGVLYLGSTKPGDEPVTAVDAKGVALKDQSVIDNLEGIIVLDGTWSQAKALWWRNPWLLKCRRLVLNPPFASHYGTLRREPRRESLSTLESAGFALASLEGRPELLERLLAAFDTLLKDNKPPKIDRRRRR